METTNEAYKVRTCNKEARIGVAVLSIDKICKATLKHI